MFITNFLLHVRDVRVANPLYAMQQGLLLVGELHSLTITEAADRVSLIMEMVAEKKGEGDGQLH